MNPNRFFSLWNGRLVDCNDTITKINKFMRTPAYIISVAALTVICNLLALELVLYTLFIALGIYLMLCGGDFLPLMPIVILCYIAPSPANNPGSAKNHGSIFLPENGGIYLIILAVLFGINLLLRLTNDPKLGRTAFVRKKRSLIGSMMLLSGAYLLSGLGMKAYGWSSLIFMGAGVLVLLAVYLGMGICRARAAKGRLGVHLPGKREMVPFVAALLVFYGVFGAISGVFGDLPTRNLLFALIQGLSITAMYYLFSGAVEWKSVPKEYMAWMGMCIGFVVMPQLAENYLSRRIFMKGTGTIDRELIFTGWGMHNNIGGMMTFMLPFPFYLACTRRHGWLFNLLGTGLLFGVFLSCSRGSIMVALAVYFVAIWLVIRNPLRRKQNLLTSGVVFSIALVFCIVYFRKLMRIFDLFIEEIFIMSQRDNLVDYGLKQYLAHPIFGGSFFPQGPYVPWDWSTSEAFSSFFPPRWHNTIVQVLASGGIVGIMAYLWHRYKTLRLFLKNISREKRFIGLSLAALLLCSLMDCHFFNVGPVLFYSMALAYAENIEQSEL